MPIEAVTEVVRVPRERISPAAYGRAFVLRDRTVPLLGLGALLAGALQNAGRRRAGRAAAARADP